MISDHPEHKDEADDDGGKEDDKEENSHVVPNVPLEAHLGGDADADADDGHLDDKEENLSEDSDADN